jgi:hypothetical protein
MTSRISLAIVCLVAGVVLGVLGYAGYRGDIQWTDSEAKTAAEPTPRPVAAPAYSGKASTPKAAALPELPISLNHYENRLGRGYVVQIHNQSQKHMAVIIELENPTLEQERSGSLQLAPGEVKEIGAAQGWIFVSGETIRIKHKGYQTASLNIP